MEEGAKVYMEVWTKVALVAKGVSVISKFDVPDVANVCYPRMWCCRNSSGHPCMLKIAWCTLIVPLVLIEDHRNVSRPRGGALAGAFAVFRL